MAKKFKFTGKNDKVDLSNKDDGTIANPIDAKNGNDKVHGRNGDDVIDGGKGNDKLWGDAGNDTLISNSGNDKLNGGDGDDTAVIKGNYADAVITENGDDVTIEIGGRTIKATGIESFQFDDQTVSAGDLVNDAPTGKSTATLAAGTEDTAYVVTEAQLLEGFSDPNGDTLSVEGLAASDGATVVDNGDGTYTITPAANDNGDVTLTFNVVDGEGGSVAGTNKINFAPVDEVFNLTKDTDTPALTTEGDVINGMVSALSSENTLNALDVINDAGGTDTLKVELKADFAGFTGTGKLAGVENIELTNNGNVARTFTATGVTGADKYTLTGAVNLAGLAEIDSVVAGTRTADLSIAYASKVTDGTADALNLSITGFGTADNAATTAVDETDPVKITVAGIETVNLTATGVNVVDLSGVAAKTVTIAGAGSVEVTAVAADTKIVDATTSTGAVSLDLDGATAATSVSTGSGDDVIMADVAELAVNAVVAGGNGADTLVLTGAAGETVQYSQTGIETLGFGAQGGTLTMSLKNSSGVTGVVAYGADSDAGALDNDITLANVGAGSLAINLQGENSSGAEITSDGSGSASITVNTPASTATVDSPSVNNLDVTLVNASSVDLTVASKMQYEGTVEAAKATSASVALEGASNGATLDVDKATSVVISSVNAASTLTVLAASATSLQITNAKDLDLATSDLAAVESLTSSGAGDITLSDLDKLNSGTITNTGDVVLANVGNGGLGYGVTLSSTGAKTFTVGNITTLDQAINLTAANVVGAASVGTINAGDGNVSVNVSAGSTLALSAITGDNVTIDASGVLGVVTYGGNITVDGNLTLKGSSLQGNDQASGGDIILTGTNQTISLTGGIGVDDFYITAGATSTVITVTGDLDIDADDITVDGSGAGQAVTISLAGLANYETSEIDGSGFNDTITGGAGIDTIEAGVGADKMTGGAAADVFVFTGAVSGIALADADTINDFVTGADKMDVVGTAVSIADGTGVTFADLVTAASAAFTGGNDVYVAYNANSSGDAYVFIDENGSGSFNAGDNLVILKGVNLVSEIAAGDFI